jgi:hypothetical protein
MQACAVPLIRHDHVHDTHQWANKSLDAPHPIDPREQGAKEPDQAARAYLRAIAADPEAVHRALHAVPRSI